MFFNILKAFVQTIIIIILNYLRSDIINILTIVNIINNKNIHNFQVLLNKKLIFSRGSVALIAIIHIHNHKILKKVQLILITNY